MQVKLLWLLRIDPFLPFFLPSSISSDVEVLISFAPECAASFTWWVETTSSGEQLVFGLITDSLGVLCRKVDEKSFMKVKYVLI